VKFHQAAADVRLERSWIRGYPIRLARGANTAHANDFGTQRGINRRFDTGSAVLTTQINASTADSGKRALAHDRDPWGSHESQDLFGAELLKAHQLSNAVLFWQPRAKRRMVHCASTKTKEDAARIRYE